MRLKLVKQNTNFDFFKRWKLWLGISGLMMVVAFASFMIQGLNFGIDFRGGTTIRTESPMPVDIGVYRDAIAVLDLGDVSITEVFDPTFEADQNVAMIRIQAQEGQEAVTTEVIAAVEQALKTVRPVGRVDPDRSDCGDSGDWRCPYLHLAALRVAVRPRRGAVPGA